MSLTRDQILGSEDRKTVEVKTPEWGDGASVFVRTLTGSQREELEAAIADQKTDMRARFVAAFASDSDGAPLFTMADVQAISAKSGVVLTRIVSAGLKLNSMREKDVQEFEKNS